MPASRWKLITSVLISLIIITLAWLNRVWIAEAFALLEEARPALLAAAFALICLSYLVSGQVFFVVLHSLGYRLSQLRLWATALVAIVISQSVPAGGVGSYAFLISNFNRRGISQGESALIASLETLSYAMAMLLMFGFSLIWLAGHGLATGGASQIAGLVAIAVIVGAAIILTRPVTTLTHWLGSIQLAVGRLFGKRWTGRWAAGLIDELDRGRKLLASRRRDVVWLVLIQLTALAGHSLAMLLVLQAFDVSLSMWAVITAFGIALITSTFNVLPGGGGTVEAALVAVLSQLGAGPAAVPAAIIFRLFNFWLLTPVAGLAYHWLMHEQVSPLVSRHSQLGVRQPPESTG
ncbi:MAG: lysylphosphatidylglycerol synthase transmembrane domain-containing protein [Oscillochloridaceae bacterium umkhey_bin13]